MKISLIAAVGKNNELGKNNDLLWHLPNDLKFFKEVTSNKTIIMGENTFFSLPKMLPDRKHIVFSLSKKTFPSSVVIYNNLETFLNDYKDEKQELFVIGGGMIYKLFIDYADNIYLTEINASDKDATVYFPSFDKSKYDKEVIDSNSDNNISYKHVLYRRK